MRRVWSKHSGHFLIKEGMNVLIPDDVYCEADLHYMRKEAKKIEAGSIVSIKEIFANFYGEYIITTENIHVNVNNIALCV